MVAVVFVRPSGLSVLYCSFGLSRELSSLLSLAVVLLHAPFPLLWFCSLSRRFIWMVLARVLVCLSFLNFCGTFRRMQIIYMSLQYDEKQKKPGGVQTLCPFLLASFRARVRLSTLANQMAEKS